MKTILGRFKPIKAVVNSRGGLGNRIKPFISALRFTETVYSTCNTFNLIFRRRIPVVKAVPKGYVQFSGWRFTLKPSDKISDNFSTVAIPVLPNMTPEEIAYITEKRAIDLEYFRIPETTRKEIAVIFTSLQFSDLVESGVAAFTKGWCDDVIAVHVRSWVDEPVRKKALHNIDLFFKEIDRRDSGLRIYIATDCPSVTSSFIERYGSRVLTYPNTFNFSDCEVECALIHDFCEMVCLSRGTMLIGSYLSTFTECAWWFGGCKQHVVII